MIVYILQNVYFQNIFFAKAFLILSTYRHRDLKDTNSVQRTITTSLTKFLSFLLAKMTTRDHIDNLIDMTDAFQIAIH